MPETTTPGTEPPGPERTDPHLPVRAVTQVDVAPTPADADPTRMEAAPAPPGQDATRVQRAPQREGPGTELEARADGTLRTVAAPTVTLEVLEGERPGRTFELPAGTHTIGRSSEAAVCLFDAGASRRHAELEVSISGVILRDLGSGNGTTVNDETITEVPLQPGDEVQIGGHRFRITLEGGAGVPARASAAPVPSLAELRSGRRGLKGRSDRLLILMAAFGGIAVLLAAFALTRGRAVDHEAEQRARHTEAKEVFREGLVSFRAERWDEALTRFEKTLALHPGHPDAGRYLKATRREREAAGALDDAEALLARGDLLGASTALARISSESVQHPRVEALQTRIDQVKLAGTLDTFRAEIEASDPVTVMAVIALPATASELVRAQAELAALQAIDLQPAEALLEVARQKAPEAAETSRAADRLQVRRAGIESAIKAKQIIIDRLIDDKDKTHAQQVSEAIARTMKPVRAAFDAGDFDKVARLLRAGPAEEDTFPEVKRVLRTTRAALPRYQKSLAQAARSENTKNPSTAGDHFTSAFKAAQKISPLGKQAREARKNAVRMRTLAGRTAFNTERWPEAYAHWSKGARLDAGDTNIKKGLHDLEARAEQVYLQAYVEKGTRAPQARAGFKRVLQMTPTTSKWNQKARTQLDALGGP